MTVSHEMAHRCLQACPLSGVRLSSKYSSASSRASSTLSLTHGQRCPRRPGIVLHSCSSWCVVNMLVFVVFCCSLCSLFAVQLYTRAVVSDMIACVAKHTASDYVVCCWPSSMCSSIFSWKHMHVQLIQNNKGIFGDTQPKNTCSDYNTMSGHNTMSDYYTISGHNTMSVYQKCSDCSTISGCRIPKSAPLLRRSFGIPG